MKGRPGHMEGIDVNTALAEQRREARKAKAEERRWPQISPVSAENVRDISLSSDSEVEEIPSDEVFTDDEKASKAETMRPKGLTQAEIEEFPNFDWDESEKEEMEREEEEEGENVEELIEIALQNIEKNQGVEVGLIEELLGTEENAEQNENIETVQEVVEKFDLAKFEVEQHRAIT
ncbi:ring-infected erythrocyte surface antigen-like [Bactrocera tryoni]|uniref:ring-infected erythrocyte surface antigen-like n=1 Tax=Bactrocera tryoni TaxID=59916 RepID=UPI001A96826A|nr:ring-infected erythrocyte surface antigen-like [Bactrocera tryoni]